MAQLQPHNALDLVSCSAYHIYGVVPGWTLLASRVVLSDSMLGNVTVAVDTSAVHFYLGLAKQRVAKRSEVLDVDAVAHVATVLFGMVLMEGSAGTARFGVYLDKDASVLDEFAWHRVLLSQSFSQEPTAAVPVNAGLSFYHMHGMGGIRRYKARNWVRL